MSKWTYDELLGQEVEYSFDGQPSEVGWFVVSREPDGDRLEIRIKMWKSKPYEAQTRHIERTITLSQRYVDQIKSHPHYGTDAPPNPKFRLLA